MLWLLSEEKGGRVWRCSPSLGGRAELSSAAAAGTWGACSHLSRSREKTGSDVGLWSQVPPPRRYSLQSISVSQKFILKSRPLGSYFLQSISIPQRFHNLSLCNLQGHRSSKPQPSRWLRVTSPQCQHVPMLAFCSQLSQELCLLHWAGDWQCGHLVWLLVTYQLTNHTLIFLKSGLFVFILLKYTIPGCHP